MNLRELISTIDSIEQREEILVVESAPTVTE